MDAGVAAQRWLGVLPKVTALKSQTELLGLGPLKHFATTKNWKQNYNCGKSEGRVSLYPPDHKDQGLPSCKFCK